MKLHGMNCSCVHGPLSPVTRALHAAWWARPLESQAALPAACGCHAVPRKHAHSACMAMHGERQGSRVQTPPSRQLTVAQLLTRTWLGLLPRQDTRSALQRCGCCMLHVPLQVCVGLGACICGATRLMPRAEACVALNSLRSRMPNCARCVEGCSVAGPPFR